VNVLFLGDIVGPAAAAHVSAWAPSARREYDVDFVVANAENVLVSGPDPTNGFGMSVELVETLFRGGVDVVTSGNHAWDGPEAERVLAHPGVLRPLNLPPGRAGQGVATVESDDKRLTVVNLADAGAIADALPPYPVWRALDLAGPVLVDFHGGFFDQKVAFAHAVDGQAAAVLGTHTHEATLPLHLLPGGCAFVADVGMVGPTGGWGGIDPAGIVARMTGAADPLPPLALATGPLTIGAVLLHIDGGVTKAVRRVP
jgi:hypothetical protein